MINFKSFFKDLKSDAMSSYKYNVSDLEFLVAEILGKSRTELSIVETITKAEMMKVITGVHKLKKGLPLEIIIGHSEFFNSKILVNKYVLSPRPETELLVEKAISVIKEKLKSTSIVKVLDICSGSGAIGISLKKELGDNIILDSADISKKAIDLAKKSAAINKVNINFIKSDMFSNIVEKYDVVISNPPYIETNLIKTLEKKVQKYDPYISLDGGKDGLDFYRVLAKNEHIAKDGVMLLEIGFDQAEKVLELMKDFRKKEVIKDLEKNDRIIYLEK